MYLRSNVKDGLSNREIAAQSDVDRRAVSGNLVSSGEIIFTKTASSCNDETALQ